MERRTKIILGITNLNCFFCGLISNFYQNGKLEIPNRLHGIIHVIVSMLCGYIGCNAVLFGKLPAFAIINPIILCLSLNMLFSNKIYLFVVLEKIEKNNNITCG
uniref:Uncharacterized protein n=1 Tax=viral metagenome TaxID=1070528 RepID=A0A6C0CA79_9ZZZZ